jgi:SAM-dependent methyltransferase
MFEKLEGSFYDYPKYYDLLFGTEWKPEFDFLTDCFEKYFNRPIGRLFEPACGTGLLLIKLAQAGYDVSGLDLNSAAIDYCNARLARNGFSESTFVCDMSDFRLPRKVDAAFNTINSFRHLMSHREALGHLKCVANALKKGGIYILGLHLTPDGPLECDEESWISRRGNLAVSSRIISVDIDRRKRCEQAEMTVDIFTPSGARRLVEMMRFRTYRAAQFQKLLAEVPKLELVETYDFAYNIDCPVKITDQTEDAIYILRKR